jgi:hypothetical protein
MDSIGATKGGSLREEQHVNTTEDHAKKQGRGIFRSRNALCERDAGRPMRMMMGDLFSLGMLCHHSSSLMTAFAFK